MSKTRLFVSFDFDHDSRLKDLFVGQAKHPDTPFQIADWSIKEAIDKNWKDHARRRMKQVDCVAVLCGQHTHTAKGIDAEIDIARSENVPFFLLRGYKDLVCTRPTVAPADKMYNWTWENVAALIKGAR
jgi:hypothetical protein